METTGQDKPSVYAELIEHLQMIKSNSEINSDIIDSLLFAGIQSTIQYTMEHENITEAEAFDVARMLVLKHFDQMLLEMSQDDLLPPDE